MADLWMPGALRADVGDHAPTDQQYPAKAIAHITWDKNATAAAPKDLVPFANLKNYFTGAGINMAPHILWDPFGGRIAQFYPANSRSKSVVDLSGGTRTNRAGKVVIQIEALFFPYCRTPDGKVYASLAETPCKGWAELNAWVRSWGVLDTWPMGHPVNFEPHRDEHTWETRGGWYGHNQVPENTHTDPGSWPAFVNTPKPKYEPYPGAGFFVDGRKSPIIAAMHDRLVAVGCGRYQSTANKNVFGSGDRASVAAWQRHLGFSGADADGIPGRTSWDALKVPNV
jgi:hypothetical protein